MTCIVAIRQKNKVWIGGDSAGTNSSTRRIREDSKVFRLDKFVFGYTTSFRMGQLIRHKFQPGLLTQSNNPDNIIFDIVEQVRKILEEYKYSRIESNESTGGEFIVAWKNNLYTVYSDFQYAKVKDNFTSCGCGVSFALGSLFETGNINPHKRIIRALKTAEYFSNSVIRPFVIKKTR
jgi:ATP-dependent protease HslVU (ClpYQ) peptidase subunit